MTNEQLTQEDQKVLRVSIPLAMMGEDDELREGVVIADRYWRLTIPLEDGEGIAAQVIKPVNEAIVFVSRGEFVVRRADRKLYGNPRKAAIRLARCPVTTPPGMLEEPVLGMRLFEVYRHEDRSVRIARAETPGEMHMRERVHLETEEVLGPLRRAIARMHFVRAGFQGRHSEVLPDKATLEEIARERIELGLAMHQSFRDFVLDILQAPNEPPREP